MKKSTTAAETSRLTSSASKILKDIDSCIGLPDKRKAMDSKRDKIEGKPVVRKAGTEKKKNKERVYKDKEMRERDARIAKEQEKRMNAKIERCNEEYLKEKKKAKEEKQRQKQNKPAEDLSRAKKKGISENIAGQRAPLKLNEGLEEQEEGIDDMNQALRKRYRPDDWAFPMSHYDDGADLSSLSARKVAKHGASSKAVHRPKAKKKDKGNCSRESFYEQEDSDDADDDCSLRNIPRPPQKEQEYVIIDSDSEEEGDRSTGYHEQVEEEREAEEEGISQYHNQEDPFGGGDDSLLEWYPNYDEDDHYVQVEDREDFDTQSVQAELSHISEEPNDLVEHDVDHYQEDQGGEWMTGSQNVNELSYEGADHQSIADEQHHSHFEVSCLHPDSPSLFDTARMESDDALLPDVDMSDLYQLIN